MRHPLSETEINICNLHCFLRVTDDLSFSSLLHNYIQISAPERDKGRQGDWLGRQKQGRRSAFPSRAPVLAFKALCSKSHSCDPCNIQFFALHGFTRQEIGASTMGKKRGVILEHLYNYLLQQPLIFVHPFHYLVKWQPQKTSCSTTNRMYFGIAALRIQVLIDNLLCLLHVHNNRNLPNVINGK